MSIASAKNSSQSAAAPPLGPSTQFVKVPLRFMVVGMLAFFVALVGVAWRPEVLSTYHYNQYVVSATHLVVLGWICSIVVGAMYQLVPVALETPLHSERLARWHFYFHVIGFAGMVWMFWRWNMTQVGHFASVFAFGIGLFVYNLVRTLMRVRKWSVVATAVSCVLGWLVLTIVVGLTITAGKCRYELTTGPGTETALGITLKGLEAIGRFAGRFDPIGAMHAHAHLGVVGVFVVLIVGVSYKLVPMFTLSELQSARRAGLSILLLNFGLLGTFVTVALRSPWRLAFATALAAGLVVYGSEIRAILRARKRRVLDWGLKAFLGGLLTLVPVCLLALVLAWPGLPLTVFTGQLENAYGFLALAGVISSAILGMLYKIIPFLIWQSAYSSQVGRCRVPSLADLYSHRLQVWSFAIYGGGLVATTAGILASNSAGVRGGAGLLSLGVAFFIVNVGIILSHLFKPRTAVAAGAVRTMKPSLVSTQ